MLHYLLLSLILLSQSVFASVCPKGSYHFEQPTALKVSQDFVVPACYQKPFTVQGCSRFYDDLICTYASEGDRYQLRYILDGGYGDVDYSKLSFKGNVPKGCNRTVAAKYHKKSPKWIYRVNIKRISFDFERVGCQGSDKTVSTGDENQQHKKYRCRYRSKRLPHLEVIETVLNGKKNQKKLYLTGCR
ncbi:hypothetical protein N9D31_00645 [Oligoflexaceae bacterium]|nr:hypothetical protein [Oligoflexaceae bacterium]